MAIGRIKLHWDWKISEASKNFEKALANNAQAHIQYGFCKMFLGNHEAAIYHARIAESLDPFSLLNLYYISGIRVYTDHFDEMLKTGKKMIELEPNFYGGYRTVGVAMERMRSAKEALPEFEKAIKLQNSTLILSELGFTYGIMGEKAKALEVIEKYRGIGA